MNILITFVLSYIVTTGIYYVWYKNRHSLESNDYLKRVLYYALSVAVMFGAMYYLLDEPDLLVIIFAYVGIIAITDNVLLPTYFQKTLNTKKIDNFLPGIINTTVIFGLLYLLLF